MLCWRAPGRRSGGSVASAVSADLGRILVTGANGQLGRALIARLAGTGRVCAVVRSETAAGTLRALPESMRPEVRVLDYADTEPLTRAAQGCRFAVHLVGIIKETASSRYVDAHEAATGSLARAAAEAGLARIAYLSILGSDADSKNPCLASKGRGEQILLEAKTPAVVLRVPMVLGPGDRTAQIIRGEAHARLLPLVGGGTNRAQPIYADDVVDAILAALEKPGLDDVALDLAGPESLPARELVARAAALFGKHPTVIPIPLGLARAAAWLAEKVSSNPPFTRAMLEVVSLDDAVDPALACEALGIELTPLDEILRTCVGPEARE